jgi:hypothetical protein
MRTIKKIVAALVLIALCSYSTWKGMQTLSIVALILFLCTLYSNKVIILYDLFLSLARHAKQAKFGNLEVSIGDSFKQAVLDNINSNKEWVKAIVSDLTPTHLTILLAINLAGEYHCGHHIKNTLRELRAKGLIEHNKDTLENSDIVWLTDIGRELVNEIATVKGKK